ncbi:F-box protein SKIP28-like [Durio zibethinus]|uniref:F-box protein SKIP28-like n=1 Tax=Durio zibethinus TaxID=66656 RepID=A0A6P5Y1X8_DURZI|nr:F-box protein SKIP28-like [Durio zibethinus]
MTVSLYIIPSYNSSYHQNIMEIEQSKEHAPLSQKEFCSEEEGPGSPHEALFLVLAYLPLFELLAMSEVCKSLREAVNKDILPWLNIIVERPLNVRLTDEILTKITSKADGRLRTLALMNCARITDDGLQSVIAKNPLINKLYLPGCTGLTPNGVIRAVQTLSVHQHSLESLQINGIYNMNKQHLERLQYYLLTKQIQQQVQQKQQSLFYHTYRKFQAYRWEEFGPIIDVEICPKCNEVRIVFDCPREDCKRKRDHSLSACRMCKFCIPRCEECGLCVKPGEVEEAVCSDTLCSDCWIQLSKCNFCNKPCCRQHTSLQIRSRGSTGWICVVCHETFLSSDDVEQ